MGIDIYLKWDGITDDDKQKQLTGFSLTSGHLGYLRQSFYKPDHFTGNYPIESLIPEAFADNDSTASIPVDKLKIMLPYVISELFRFYSNEKLNLNDNVTVYDIVKSYIDFVALAERKELETGKPCTIIVR